MKKSNQKRTRERKPFISTFGHCQGKTVIQDFNCLITAFEAMDELMYKKLHELRETRPHSLESHADFPALVRAMFGTEGLAFMRETGYHSLFTSVAHHALLDFLATERWGSLSYPVGGMSQFPERMLRRAQSHGMKIFRGEPVRSITSDVAGKFLIETPSLKIKADKVLCSIDPLGFAGVNGNVADRVKASPEFQVSYFDF